MNSIHLLLPDVDVAKRVVSGLLFEGVKWEDIHILADSTISLEDLPEFELSEKSDVFSALTRGGAYGGLTGMLAGLIAVAIPGVGTVAGGAVLATTLAGASLGAWSASLIGVSVPNTSLEKYQNAIDRGELLMMVDLTEYQEDEVKSIILSSYPDADFNATHQEEVPMAH